MVPDVMDQLADLWIGEPAMPPYAVLYDPERPDGTYNRTWGTRGTFTASHYASSTIYNNSNPYLYWAEEFGSTSYFGQWRNLGQHMANLSVRCIRNLGKYYNDTTMPQDYMQVKDKATGNLVTNITPGNTNNISTEYTISLEYIDPRALRGNIVENAAAPYSIVDSPTENNRSYVAFDVLPGYYGIRDNVGTVSRTTTWYRAHQGEEGLASRVCPDGYRVPNQREMVIMRFSIDGWNYNDMYLARNDQLIEYNNGANRIYGAFYFYADENRFGRETANQQSGLTATAAVRCVKDNPNANPNVAGKMEDGGSLTN